MALGILTFALPVCAYADGKTGQPDKQIVKQPASAIPVKGKIVDESGEPVIGATIRIEGSSLGTVSDADGRFSLSSVRKNAKLIISYIGYKTQEIVADKGYMDIVMREDTETLDEVVVMGYGTLKKAQLVGAVENLSGETLEGRVTPNLTRSLQGQISGLNIIQVDGKPSHQGQIYVRGGNTSYNTRKSMTNADGQRLSIGQGGSALVLIDGVEGDLSTLNPEDIETVSVLKDASSAAVYGARGAFGVILVTTKKPDKGNLQISYNGSVSLNRRTVQWEDHLVTDGLQWLDNFVTFFQNDTRTPTSSGKVPGNVNNRSDTYSEAYHEEFRRRRAAGDTNPYGMTENGNYAYYGSTNWIDLFYKDLTVAQTHNISISNSSERTSWLLSGRFYDQDGIYKIGDEAFKTYNLRAKGELRLNKWLTLENNTALFSQKYHQPMVAGGSQPLLRQFEHRGQPIYTPFNEDGTLSFYGAATMYGAFMDGSSYQENNSLDLVTTTALNFEPLKDVLKLRADFTYKVSRDNQVRISDIQEGYSAPNTTEAYNTTSYKSDWRYNTDYLSSNVVLTWIPKLGENHNLNVVGGWNIETQKYRRLYLQRQGLLDYQSPSFELMDGDEYAVEDDGYDKSLVGVFTRINYTLLNRYILEFSSRYDGSSLFPANERWGLEAVLCDQTGISEMLSFFDGEIFCGFVIMLHLDNYSLFIFFAIEDALRSHGYGSEALRLIHERMPERTIMVDIEREAPGADNNEQRRRRKSGRTRSDDSNRFPAPFCHRTNFHQSVGERLLHDVAFDLADGHRFKIESAGAGPLAERRTDPRCEFREAACRREQIPRLLHPAVCNRLVEFRNLVPERTACSMAERDAAVHAALRLLLQDFRRRRNFHFAEIVNTFFNRAIGMRPAFQIIKCAFLILSHDQSPPSLNCCV